MSTETVFQLHWAASWWFYWCLDPNLSTSGSSIRVVTGQLHAPFTTSSQVLPTVLLLVGLLFCSFCSKTTKRTTTTHPEVVTRSLSYHESIRRSPGTSGSLYGAAPSAKRNTDVKRKAKPGVVRHVCFATATKSCRPYRYIITLWSLEVWSHSLIQQWTIIILMLLQAIISPKITNSWRKSTKNLETHQRPSPLSLITHLGRSILRLQTTIKATENKNIPTSSFCLGFSC